MSSNYLDAVRSVFSGSSQRQAAQAHGISRDTVSVLVKYAHSRGWQQTEDLASLSEADFEPAMRRKSGTGENRDPSYQLPHYEYVHAELGKDHVTLKLLWEEYVADCIANNKRYYMETQFRRYYHHFAKTQKATIRLEHKPGVELQVDWAGSHIAYYDEDLGQMAEAHLFVAVLPCSSLLYAEPFRNEQLPNWITAHANAFRYFGGVPKTLVPDNLKVGIDKAVFYEPKINRTYQEMARYYGTAILPTRVRKPRDKGAVENGVKIASHRILGKLRNKTFHNFHELQIYVASALEAVNSAVVTGKSVSRWGAFHSEEKAYLLTLPAEPYVISEWSQAKVQSNCHVSYQGYFYSAPFEYCGETVDIRATSGTVEIFYHHQRVASHRREWGKNQYSTVQDHMPPGKLFFANWDADRFLKWAVQIGPSCRKVIQLILDRAVIEQQAYRACFGILGLKDKFSSARVEQACSYLLRQTLAPTYSQVKQILDKGEDLASPQTENSEDSPPQGFRRGPGYYSKKAGNK